MEPASPQPRRGLEAFAFRDFRRYQLARMAVVLGAEAQSVAVAWQVYSITHRAIDLGYTGLALFLPGLIFLLPAGHVADRFDRRRVILACYVLQVFCTRALVVLARNNTQNILAIYAVLFLVGTGRAFSSPASSALIPHLVPETHFVNAVTWGGAIFQFANITGPAMGGLLFTLPLAGIAANSRLEGAGIVYVFTLGTLVWFLTLVVSLHVRPGRMEHRDLSLKVVLAGFRYVLRARILLGSFSLDLFVVLLGGAVALMPIFAHEILHQGPRGLGHAARGSGGGRGNDVIDHGSVSSASPRGALAVHLRRNLRRGHGDLRAVALTVALAGVAGYCGRSGHHQRDHSRLAAATGHAAGDAWTRERCEFVVHRRVKRAGRI